MSDNGDLTIGLRADTDAASFKQARDAVASVGDAARKMAADIERSKALDGLARDFAQIAKETGSVGSSMRLLVADAEKLKATDVEVKKLVADFNQYRKAVDSTAASTKELAKAQDEVSAAPSPAASGSGQGLGNFLRTVGREGRALPAVNIPGAGISTDAVSKIVGLGGSLVDLSEKSALATAATNALTPALGAQQAATIGALAPIALLAAAVGGIALVIGAAATEANKGAEALKNYSDSQRKINESVASGQTSKEAEVERKRLQDLQKGEKRLLEETSAAYADFEKQALAAVKSSQSFDTSLLKLTFGTQGAVEALKVLNPAEEQLYQDRQKSEALLKTYAQQEADLTKSLEDGTYAVNDAAAALANLSKSALASSEAAGRDLASQQAALNASEEQNKKRLDSIKDEAAVAQRQIDVLTQSGVTSAEVTDKIAALNSQLGSLGKESEFIKGTALEASRQADAAKKSKKDAEDAQKKVEAAQEAIIKLDANFANKKIDLERQSNDRLADLRTANNDKLQDIDKKYFNDTVKLAQDARAEEAKAQRARERDELQAVVATNRKIKDLEEEALANQEEFTNDRNFLAAAKVAEGLAKSNKAAIKEYDRAAEDREAAAKAESAERYLQLNEARDARADAYRQELSDNRENYKRQLRDAGIAKDRQLNEAKIAYDRELETQQAFLTQMGANNAAFYAGQVSMAQQAAGAASGSSGGSSVPVGGGSSAGSFPGGSFPSGGFGGLRPIPTASAARGGNAITANIYANTSEDVYLALERLKVI